MIGKFWKDLCIIDLLVSYKKVSHIFNPTLILTKIFKQSSFDLFNK